MEKDLDSRDPVTGYLSPNMTKFPEGIKGLADKVHGYGLKFGIYSSGSYQTCQDYPASLGHEDTDAQAFAEWGVDCRIIHLRLLRHAAHVNDVDQQTSNTVCFCSS